MIRRWLAVFAIALTACTFLLPISPARAGLYSFSEHTFTNCGNIGVNGPTLANCTSAYSSASWSSSASNFNISSGIQLWTVPQTGIYTITAVGAAGGKALFTGGKGASIQGRFNLTQGDVIKILVGQYGDTSTALPASQSGSGGGGGGTFVYNNTTSTVLVVAGGGGGSGAGSAGRDATVTETGTAGNPGGNPGTTTGGTLSAATYSGGSGGGWVAGSDGVKNAYGALPGSGGAGLRGYGSGSPNGATLAYPFFAGGAGGYPTAWGTQTTYYGGFGGGGNGHFYTSNNSYLVGGGGGGGYSGGGGGDGSGTGGGGGGGGSYNSGSFKVNTAGVGAAHGYVYISFQTVYSSVSVGLENGASSVTYRGLSTPRLRADTADDGKVTFYMNGKVIPGCKRISTNTRVAYCSWKPSIHGTINVSAVVESTNGAFVPSGSTTFAVNVDRRTTSR